MNFSSHNFRQRDIKLILKVFQLNGNGRLCQLKLFSSLGDASGLNNLKEDVQLIEGVVHIL